jgi:Protein of unknown function (DUF3987)
MSALAAWGIDHELYLEWKKECEQLEAQHQMALDAQAAEGKSKKSVKKPEKPPLKHLLHDDTSLEKLTINMAASPHGAVAFYSELAAWFASFSRYSGGDDSSGRAPPPPARLSAQSNPTSFGKSGPSLMTACWRGQSMSGHVWRLCHRSNSTITATMFRAAKLTPSERP